MLTIYSPICCNWGLYPHHMHPLSQPHANTVSKVYAPHPSNMCHQPWVSLRLMHVPPPSLLLSLQLIQAAIFISTCVKPQGNTNRHILHKRFLSIYIQYIDRGSGDIQRWSHQRDWLLLLKTRLNKQRFRLSGADVISDSLGSCNTVNTLGIRH